MKDNGYIIRKVGHILFGLLIVIGIITIEKSIFIKLLLVLFLFTVFLTMIHVKYRIKSLEKIAKENEKRFPLKGMIFFIVGVAIVILIFSRNIALAAIFVLTFGDLVSSLAGFFGTKYKINPFRKWKSIFGTFCGMVVAFLFALIFVDPLICSSGCFLWNDC